MKVFEPLVVTVSWLLRSNPGAEFICSVQVEYSLHFITSLSGKTGFRQFLCLSKYFPYQFGPGKKMLKEEKKYWMVDHFLGQGRRILPTFFIVLFSHVL